MGINLKSFHPFIFAYVVEELQSEFFRDIEVATLVDPERSRKSTSDSSSVTSRDSRSSAH